MTVLTPRTKSVRIYLPPCSVSLPNSALLTWGIVFGAYANFVRSRGGYPAESNANGVLLLWFRLKKTIESRAQTISILSFLKVILSVLVAWYERNQRNLALKWLIREVQAIVCG